MTPLIHKNLWRFCIKNEEAASDVSGRPYFHVSML